MNFKLYTLVVFVFASTLNVQANSGTDTITYKAVIDTFQIQAMHESVRITKNMLYDSAQVTLWASDGESNYAIVQYGKDIFYKGFFDSSGRKINIWTGVFKGKEVVKLTYEVNTQGQLKCTSAHFFSYRPRRKGVGSSSMYRAAGLN